MKVRQFATEQLAVVYVAAMIESMMGATAHPVLGLATGATPIPLYRQLVELHRQGLSFRQVRTINLDEYVGLPAEHPQSYHQFMNDHLFNHLDIPDDQIFLLNGQAADLNAECERYDRIIASHPIDLQIVGIGRNGHIGFNEPATSLKTFTHVVTLAPDTIAANTRFFSESQPVPRRAMTMGIESIMQAKSIILMAFGRDKAQAVKCAVSGEISTCVPASFLQLHPNVTVVLDKEAGTVSNCSLTKQ